MYTNSIILPTISDLSKYRPLVNSVHIKIASTNIVDDIIWNEFYYDSLFMQWRTSCNGNKATDAKFRLCKIISINTFGNLYPCNYIPEII